MTAVRMGGFLEIETRFNSLAGIGEVELMPSSDPVSFPALHIFDHGHSIVETEAQATRYACSGSVEGYVELTNGPAAYAALNDLYTRAVAKLMEGEPLDGLAESLDEGDMRIAIAELASERRLGFAFDFEFIVVTQRGDPAQAA